MHTPFFVDICMWRKPERRTCAENNRPGAMGRGTASPLNFFSFFSFFVCFFLFSHRVVSVVVRRTCSGATRHCNRGRCMRIRGRVRGRRSRSWRVECVCNSNNNNNNNKGTAAAMAVYGSYDRTRRGIVCHRHAGARREARRRCTTRLLARRHIIHPFERKKELEVAVP